MNICPKCGKTEFWELGRIETDGAPRGIWVKFVSERKKTLSISPMIWSYACKNCGYIESYVNPEDLKKTVDE
jgi:predicted nucleic-acid-binding Zn-ribbon protein